jgi:hypothetical protein
LASKFFEIPALVGDFILVGIYCPMSKTKISLVTIETSTFTMEMILVNTNSTNAVNLDLAKAAIHSTTISTI